MKRVAAPKRRRNRNFDLNPMRRREIIRHAIHVGAMDTEDRDRWLIAWHWYNHKAKDPIWSLMEAAKRMGGKITEAEASAVTEEASIIRKCWTADNLARLLGVTYAQRQELRLKTIGSTDIKRGARKVLRQRKDRLYREAKRRAAGMRPQSQFLSATQPWRQESMSRAAWYRQNKHRKTGETTLSAVSFLSKNDRPVSPEGGAGMEFERGFASKEARGHPSSQTAATPAADRFESLPVELRLLALGLPVSENLARVVA